MAAGKLKTAVALDTYLFFYEIERMLHQALFLANFLLILHPDQAFTDTATPVSAKLLHES